jgi:hypothetical protein
LCLLLVIAVCSKGVDGLPVSPRRAADPRPKGVDELFAGLRAGTSPAAGFHERSFDDATPPPSAPQSPAASPSKEASKEGKAGASKGAEER